MLNFVMTQFLIFSLIRIGINFRLIYKKKLNICSFQHLGATHNWFLYKGRRTHLPHIQKCHTEKIDAKIDNWAKRTRPPAVSNLHVNLLDLHLICTLSAMRGLIRPYKTMLEIPQRRTWNPVKNLNDGPSCYF